MYAYALNNTLCCIVCVVWCGYWNLPYLCAHVKLCVVSSLINRGFGDVCIRCAYIHENDDEYSMRWYSFSWWIKYWLIYISIIRKRIIKIWASFSSYWLEREKVCVCLSECVMYICTYKWIHKHIYTARMLQSTEFSNWVLIDCMMVVGCQLFECYRCLCASVYAR